MTFPLRMSFFLCTFAAEFAKNGFVPLTKKKEYEHTRLMYFDMMQIE